MNVKIKLKGIASLKALEKALDPARASQILDQTIRQAHARIGMAGVAAVRNGIRRKEYVENSPITIILKGSSAPLVNRGDLFQAISYEQPDSKTLRIGVLRRRDHKGTVVDLAVVLHEGATIDVNAHPKVRIAVWAAVARALGGASSRTKAGQSATWGAAGKLAGSSGTAKGKWVIPPRPFLARPLLGPVFLQQVEAIYGKAAKAAIDRIAGG